METEYELLITLALKVPLEERREAKAFQNTSVNKSSENSPKVEGWGFELNQSSDLEKGVTNA
jgi:hypothetical protein